VKDAFDGVVGFEWDEGNTGKNRIAHAVENWECEQIFFNQSLLVLDDPNHSLTEKRWAALGRTDSGRPLVVVFTVRGNRVRIISARDMNRRERVFYEESE
jgi:uncharacterized DUF497 family protein